MRELEEGVARLNDAGAPLLEAEDAQGCDSKGDALAHSKSSEKRGYSRRGVYNDGSIPTQLQLDNYYEGEKEPEEDHTDADAGLWVLLRKCARMED